MMNWVRFWKHLNTVIPCHNSPPHSYLRNTQHLTTPSIPYHTSPPPPYSNTIPYLATSSIPPYHTAPRHRLHTSISYPTSPPPPYLECLLIIGSLQVIKDGGTHLVNSLGYGRHSQKEKKNGYILIKLTGALPGGRWRSQWSGTGSSPRRNWDYPHVWLLF